MLRRVALRGDMIPPAVSMIKGLVDWGRVRFFSRISIPSFWAAAWGDSGVFRR